jgi:hypothetical protein
MNIIDMETITTRYAELRDERADLQTAIDDAEEAQTDAEEDADTLALSDAFHAATEALNEWDADNDEEFRELAELIEELRGAGGGDHKFEGDWFPGQLIDVSDFEEYAQELAEDCYDMPDGWPFRCIDWEQAARELAMDYSMVSYQGTDYYWR